MLPTGGGKSILYQLPPLLVNGTAVVISPLLSLMAGQVDDLCRRGISAGRLGSDVTKRQARVVLEKLVAGALHILFLAPEWLTGPNSVELFDVLVKLCAEKRLAVLAVNEAHCDHMGQVARCLPTTGRAAREITRGSNFGRDGNSDACNCS